MPRVVALKGWPVRSVPDTWERSARNWDVDSFDGRWRFVVLTYGHVSYSC